MVWDDTDHFGGIAYTNSRLLLFGGFKGISSLSAFTDTLWSGTITGTEVNWTALPLRVNPDECDPDEVILNNLSTGIPQARADAAMLFQGPPYNRVLLHGGDTTPGQNGGELGDLWVLDLGAATCSTGLGYLHWFPDTTMEAERPGARMGHGLVFDTRPRTALYPELYDPANESVSLLSNAKRWMYSYPFMHLLPSGDVFYSGPDSRTAALNLNAGWGATIQSSFSGDTSIWLPTSTGSQVMKCGQKVAPQGSNSRRVGYISFGSGTPSWAVLDNSLPEDRQDANITVLPDGRALLSGGVRNGFDDPDNESRAGVKRPLIWDPETRKWNVHASQVLDILDTTEVVRDYHSIALLLPDATVFTAGGEDTTEDFGGEARRMTGEIFYPPYLFDGDDWAPRPVILCVDEAVAYGTTFALTVADTHAVERVTMVRPGSVTHGFDQDQRFVPLSISSSTISGGSRRVIASAPASGAAAPPGDYLVFAFRDSVPSVGTWVRVVQGRSGTLAASETWLDTETPVVLSGDLTIPSGKTLSIGAGVRVLSASVSPRPKLIVQGTLEVSGTSNSRVGLGNPCGSAVPVWEGIVVQQGGSIDIEHADIQAASIGIDVEELVTAVISIKNNLFRHNDDYDVRVVRADTTGTCHLTITGNVDSVGSGTGIYLRGNMRAMLFSENSFFGTGGSGGSVSGLFVDSTNVTYPPLIADNTFSGFLAGQGLKLGPGKTIVRGNTFSGGKYGAYVQGGTHEFTPEYSTETANVFSNNTHSGIFFIGSGTNPTMRRNLSTGNYNGAVAKSGAKPDFGTATDHGNNSIVDYSNKCLWNQTTGSQNVLQAKGNFWDVACPDWTEILTCIVNASYFPTLCSSPLGAIRRDIAVEEVPKAAEPLTSLSGAVIRGRSEFLVAKTGSIDWKELLVFDVLGRLRSVIALHGQESGSERVDWAGVDRSGAPLPSGLYFAVLRNDVAESRAVRLVLLREGGRR